MDVKTYKVGDRVVLVDRRKDRNADLPEGSVGTIVYVASSVFGNRPTRVCVEWEGFHRGHSYPGGPSHLTTVWDVDTDAIEHDVPPFYPLPTNAEVAGLFGGITTDDNL